LAPFNANVFDQPITSEKILRALRRIWFLMGSGHPGAFSSGVARLIL
jgi:hypothetical protein